MGGELIEWVPQTSAESNRQFQGAPLLRKGHRQRMTKDSEIAGTSPRV